MKSRRFIEPLLPKLGAMPNGTVRIALHRVEGELQGRSDRTSLLAHAVSPCRLGVKPRNGVFKPTRPLSTANRSWSIVLVLRQSANNRRVRAYSSTNLLKSVL